jgi:hypothetical protein
MDTTLHRRNELNLTWLILALFAGPAGWVFTQGVGYALVKPVCASGDAVLLGLIALVGLATAGAGAWLAWQQMWSLRRVALDSGRRAVDRSYFIAMVAAGLDVLIALLIVTTVAAQVWNRCE